MGGALPRNVRLLRVERLAQDLPGVLREAGVIATGEIPHLNASRYGDWRTYYTAAAERAVYRRYKWVFDRGYYERIDPTTFPFVAQPRFNGNMVPLSGPAHQIGPISGWSDGVAGPVIKVRVKLDAPIRAVAVEGSCLTLDNLGLDVKLAIDKFSRNAQVQAGPFRVEVPCRYPRGSEVEIVIATSTVRNEDERERNNKQVSISFDCIHCAEEGRVR
jgi:hypothetical protein